MAALFSFERVCDDVQVGRFKKISAETPRLNWQRKKSPQSHAGLHSIMEKTPRSFFLVNRGKYLKEI